MNPHLQPVPLPGNELPGFMDIVLQTMDVPEIYSNLYKSRQLYRLVTTDANLIEDYNARPQMFRLPWAFRYSRTGDNGNYYGLRFSDMRTIRRQGGDANRLLVDVDNSHFLFKRLDNRNLLLVNFITLQETVIGPPATLPENRYVGDYVLKLKTDANFDEKIVYAKVENGNFRYFEYDIENNVAWNEPNLIYDNQLVELHPEKNISVMTTMIDQQVFLFTVCYNSDDQPCVKRFVLTEIVQGVVNQAQGIITRWSFSGNCAVCVRMIADDQVWDVDAFIELISLCVFQRNPDTNHFQLISQMAGGDIVGFDDLDMLYGGLTTNVIDGILYVSYHRLAFHVADHNDTCFIMRFNLNDQRWIDHDPVLLFDGLLGFNVHHNAFFSRGLNLALQPVNRHL